MSNSKPTIYLFGNPLVETDCLPLLIADRLKKRFPMISFYIIDPNENLTPDTNGELIMIDTVVGIDKVAVIHNIDQLADEPKYSLHDFDLGFQLKLLKKIGILKKVTIFGVPQEVTQDTAFTQLIPLLQTYLAENRN
jgi:Ni,Fe-hydrogenase maturation factor